MPYPLSSPVSAGQPTAAAHYNDLRQDTLTLGAADSDAVKLATFLQRFVSGMQLVYLATNRVRVAFSPLNPPTIMINGYMLQATSNVDLPPSQFSGVSALYYIFANRTAGSKSFTLSVNTSSTEAADQRLVGTAYWDGSSVTQITSYYGTNGLPAADYDSGWFAVSYNTNYAKAHGLNAIPRTYLLLHATDSAGASENVAVTVCFTGTDSFSVIGFTNIEILISCPNSSAYGTVTSTRRSSGSGYYRILAWR
jgi:hypothetical protein